MIIIPMIFPGRMKGSMEERASPTRQMPRTMPICNKIFMPHIMPLFGDSCNRGGANPYFRGGGGKSTGRRLAGGCRVGMLHHRAETGRQNCQCGGMACLVVRGRLLRAICGGVGCQCPENKLPFRHSANSHFQAGSTSIWIPSKARRSSSS